MVRGDARRVLIVCPGMLVDQWQDELREKFHLPFEIVTRQMIDASYAGNPFLEKDLLIARLDHLSRSEELLAKLSQSDWDLVICDEAHKMSAHYFGSEVKETKRYKLGLRLGEMTRHLLLMTATPHSGKPEDFDLFMAGPGNGRRGIQWHRISHEDGLGTRCRRSLSRRQACAGWCDWPGVR